MYYTELEAAAIIYLAIVSQWINGEKKKRGISVHFEAIDPDLSKFCETWAYKIWWGYVFPKTRMKIN